MKKQNKHVIPAPRLRWGRLREVADRRHDSYARGSRETGNRSTLEALLPKFWRTVLTMKPQKGFSLVELSVVLVIIGAIVASIASGVFILQTAKLRAVISDMKSLETAFNSFKAYYRQIPGDFNKASQYWAGAPEGDGNGKVEWTNSEDHYAPNHLQLAELISGPYDGSTGFLRGVDLVPAKISANNAVHHFGHTANLYTQHGNVLGLLGGNPTANYAVLNSEDAKYIDEKMDDGKPSRGRLITIVGSGLAYNVNCVTSGMDNTWILGSSDPECRMYYFLDDKN